jgi:hypothetical protein
MGIKNWLQKRKNSAPVLIKFEGGMGNQLLNAALYFYLENSGKKVYADLSYFEKETHVAEVGRKGEISRWPWQLGEFGIMQSQFQILEPPIKLKKSAVILPDDGNKLQMVLNALKQDEIRKRFKIEEDIENILPNFQKFNYLCIHIRRGDYVNVASHVVSDEQFIQQARKFSGLISNAVILSDSPISNEMQHTFSSLYTNMHFLDSTDAMTAPKVMRLSRVLICSNSQFSMIGAALNTKALILLPMQWLGKGESNRSSEEILKEYSPFMVMG